MGGNEMTERLSIIILKARLYTLKESYQRAKIEMTNNPNGYDDEFIQYSLPIIAELEKDILILEGKEETK
jgi:hypothetical protein